MKLLAAQTATTATNLGLGKATAVAVYASAITIISEQFLKANVTNGMYSKIVSSGT